MHLLITFAAALDEQARQALAGLVLPQLTALLARLGARAPDPEEAAGDERSLSAPHERALARAFGWPLADGALPLAAWQAAADGIEMGRQPWVRLTPAHWHLGTEQVSLLDPAELLLTADESRALLDAVRELFESEGFTLAWGAPLRWYAAHPLLEGMRNASLDRVVGRNVDRWLAAAPTPPLLRRLQNEVQMLLYTHPLNAARELAGALPVNSYWLDGCGAQRPATAQPLVDERLRAPALAGDWAAWSAAWQALDAGPLAELARRDAAGEPVRLTLAGERRALDWASAPRGLWQRLSGALRRPGPVQSVLEQL